MSDSVLGGIVGALLAGAFLITAQVLASRSQADTSRKASDAQVAIARETFQAQAEMAHEASKAQADMAREAWERGQRAEAYAALEAACLEVIRYAQQIETAVHNWETGAMQGSQALASINSAAAAVTEVGYGILLRKPYDLSGALIGRLLLEANGFTMLNDPARNPPASMAEKKAQALVVGNLKTELYDHIHKAKAQGISGSP
jgi:hypothetical protein